MELDETGFPQPTGRFETLAADTVILALGQDADTAFLRAGARSRVQPGRHRAGVSRDDDRMPWRVRRRRHGASRAHGDRRRRARQEGSRRTSTPGCGRSAGRHQDQAPGRHVRPAESVVLRRRRQRASSRRPSRAADGGLRRGGRRPVRARSRLRGGPVPVLRQLLRVRRLPRGVPGRRGHQAGPRSPVRIRLRPVHRLRRVLRAVPGALDRDDHQRARA